MDNFKEHFDATISKTQESLLDHVWVNTKLYAYAPKRFWKN